MYIRAYFDEFDSRWTREDFSEFLEYPLEEMFQKDFGVSARFRCYCDDDKTLETDCDFSDQQFTIYTTIDYRKIKRPSDLQNYAYVIYRQIIEEYGDVVGIE